MVVVWKIVEARHVDSVFRLLHQLQEGGVDARIVVGQAQLERRAGRVPTQLCRQQQEGGHAPVSTRLLLEPAQESERHVEGVGAGLLDARSCGAEDSLRPALQLRLGEAHVEMPPRLLFEEEPDLGIVAASLGQQAHVSRV